MLWPLLLRSLSSVALFYTAAPDYPQPPQRPAASWDTFPSGLLCSEAHPTSLLLWTRTPNATSLTFEVHNPKTKTTKVVHAKAEAWRGNVATVEVNDLQPNTVYTWRAVLPDGTPSPFARCKTAPQPGSATPVSFLVSGDIAAHARAMRQDRFGIFTPMAQHNADFFISLGDWPYADNSKDLKDLRETYAKHRSEPRLLDFLTTTSVYAIFDDHEVTNDWDGRTRKDEADLVRRSLRVWSEWFPLRANAKASKGAVYHRSFVWGEVAFFMLDARSRRDAMTRRDGLQQDGLPRKTMLGEEQRAWLVEGLAASKARFKIVLSSVPLDYGTTGADHWSGYRAERDWILGQIERRGVEGVVFLTADQHWYSANHYPNGVKEFQFGPLTATVRRAGPQRHETVRVREERNYGYIVYDPVQKTLRVESRDARGVLMDVETVRAEMGRLRVASDTDGEALLCVVRGEGVERTCAHAFRVEGSRRLERAPVGSYRVEWGEVPGYVRPDAMDVEVKAGEEVEVRGEYRRREVALPWSVSFRKGSWDGLRVVDEASQEGGGKAPQWTMRKGSLVEVSGYGREVKGRPELSRGTMVVGGDIGWRDVDVRGSVLPMDNDTVGLVVQYRDVGTYTRVEVDRQQGAARVVRCVGGECRVLASERVGYRVGRRIELRARVRGESVEFWVGKRGFVKAVCEGCVLEAQRGGAVGVYSRSSRGAFFEGVSVKGL